MIFPVIPALAVGYAFLNPEVVEPIKEETVERVKISLTEAELMMIGNQLKLEAMHGRLPAEHRFGQFLRDELRSHRTDPSLDVWGSAYRLRIKPAVVVISSSGPDKMAWTADDLTVTVKRPSRGELLVRRHDGGAEREVEAAFVLWRPPHTAQAGMAAARGPFSPDQG